MGMLFAIKLIVTPLLMLLVTLSARRWGSFVGGILSGMPLTSGSISIYMAVEQGAYFAQRSALSSLTGVGAVLFTYLCYIALTRRYSLSVACAGSVFLFCGVSWLLLNINSTLLSIGTIVLAIFCILVFTRKYATSSLNRQPPSFDLATRIIIATTMVLALTASANTIGSDLSGILAPIPVIAWPLTVFTHIQNGRADALNVIRGNAISGVGVLAFYLTVERYITQAGFMLTFSLAICVSLLASLFLLFLVRKLPWFS
ncbi:hypothetical protein [Xenorhabdus entomophaga]|uniref:hypothetical protein n=1 Tax=Xenorhabdus entomophaga TaxID=3136257 RepID=UPI0030F464B5